MKFELLSYYIARLNRLSAFYESNHDHLHTSMAGICTKETLRIYPAKMKELQGEKS